MSTTYLFHVRVTPGPSIEVERSILALVDEIGTGLLYQSRHEGEPIRVGFIDQAPSEADLESLGERIAEELADGVLARTGQRPAIDVRAARW